MPLRLITESKRAQRYAIKYGDLGNIQRMIVKMVAKPHQS